MSTDRWADKEVVEYIYTMEYHSALKKKEENPVICNHMNEPGGHYAKRNNPTQKDRYCMISLICES